MKENGTGNFASLKPVPSLYPSSLKQGFPVLSDSLYQQNQVKCIFNETEEMHEGRMMYEYGHDPRRKVTAESELNTAVFMDEK